MLIKVRAGKHMIITRVAQISTSREVILVFFWVNISRDAALSHFYFYHLSSFDPGVGVGVAVLGAEWSPDGASDDRKTDSCSGRKPVFSVDSHAVFVVAWFLRFRRESWHRLEQLLADFFLGRGKCVPFSINHAYLMLVGCGCLFYGRNPDHSMVIWVICYLKSISRVQNDFK